MCSHVKAHVSSQTAREGKHFHREEKRSWEGYSKQKVHGFLLAESLREEKESFLFLLGSAVIRDMRAPSSSIPNFT